MLIYYERKILLNGWLISTNEQVHALRVSPSVQRHPESELVLFNLISDSIFA
jgi:hypothetical protein